LDAIAAFGAPVFKDVRNMSWPEAHQIFPIAQDKRFYIAGQEIEKQDDASMKLILQTMEKARSLPGTDGENTGPGVLFFTCDKALGKAPQSPAAYNLRGGFEVEYLSTWDNPSDDHLFETWVKQAAVSLGSSARPAVIANSAVDEEVMRRSFGADYERLV